MHYETRRYIAERLLTAQELADLLGVPLNTIQTRARRGNIEGVKKGPGQERFLAV